MSPRLLIAVFAALASANGMAQGPQDPGPKKKKQAPQEIQTHVTAPADSVRYVTKNNAETVAHKVAHNKWDGCESGYLTENLSEKKSTTEKQAAQAKAQPKEKEQPVLLAVVAAKKQGGGNVGGSNRGAGNVGGGNRGAGNVGGSNHAITGDQWTTWQNAISPLDNASIEASQIILETGAFGAGIEIYENGLRDSRDTLEALGQKNSSYRMINAILQVGQSVDEMDEVVDNSKRMRFKADMYENFYAALIKQMESREIYMSNPYYYPSPILIGNTLEVKESEIAKLAYVGHLLEWFSVRAGSFTPKTHDYLPAISPDFFVALGKPVMKAVELELAGNALSPSLSRVRDSIATIIKRLDEFKDKTGTDAALQRVQINIIATSLEKVQTNIKSVIRSVSQETLNVDNKPQK